jgi:hypothetical protein
VIGGLIVYTGSLSAARIPVPQARNTGFFIQPATDMRGQVARGATIGFGGRF